MSSAMIQMIFGFDPCLFFNIVPLCFIKGVSPDRSAAKEIYGRVVRAKEPRLLNDLAKKSLLASFNAFYLLKGVGLLNSPPGGTQFVSRGNEK